jgi:hypothetical protein
VPLRPLTTGELLDGAVALLRTRPWRLVALGLLLAVVEQAVLYPLRAAADQDISLQPANGHLPEYGLLIATGFVTETLAISTLAAIAARQSGVALLGRAAPAPRPTSWGSVVTTIVLVAAVVAACTSLVVRIIDGLGLFAVLVAWFTAFLLWALPYGLLGLAAPAVVVERASPLAALLRSLRLSGRDGLRAVFIRGIGYVSWVIVRLGLLIATLALIHATLGNLPSSTWDRVVIGATALVINTVAYAVLGCLDVIVLLETRMRTEGLDISLRWAMRRGVAPSLEAPR